MVKINSTLKAKEIQAMFDGKEYGGVTFHFTKKVGMGLMFDIDNPDGKSADDVKNLVKSTLKTDPILKALLITVEVNL
ncbi:MAG: hypothetical protein HFG71_10720 [Hungatella sp.]|jgi:hypothetical protein|nr:hypothetical protein [Hungatella sp.]